MWGDRLLQTPFDFSQAFDRALKNIVGILPNRPPRESAEDVVCHDSRQLKRKDELISPVDVLLCLDRKLRRVRMQSSNFKLILSKPYGVS